MSVKELTEAAPNLKIYPNPSTGILNYSWFGINDAKKITLNIFEASARQVLSEIRPSHNGQIDIQFLSEGFYIIEFGLGSKVERLSLLGNKLKGRKGL